MYSVVSRFPDFGNPGNRQNHLETEESKMQSYWCGRLFCLFIRKYVGRVVHILWSQTHLTSPYMDVVYDDLSLKIELNGWSFGWALSGVGTLECHHVILEPFRLWLIIDFEDFFSPGTEMAHNANLSASGIIGRPNVSCARVTMTVQGPSSFRNKFPH